MKKTIIVLKREFLSRVKKKSFIIMTLLAPLLMAAFIVGYAYVLTSKDKEEKKIGIIDDSMVIFESLKNSKYITFELITDKSLDDFKQDFEKLGYYSILHIPSNIIVANRLQLYSDKQPSESVKMYIKGLVKTYLEDKRLVEEGISKDVLNSLKVKLSIDTFKWTDSGEEVKSNTGITMGIGYFAGFLIYMFVFIYGAMVMRGVIEEKTSRIVEIIISSVKPFQLMLGKIVGVALVGLTQFVVWVILIGVFVTIGMTLFGPESSADTIASQQEMVQDIMSQENMPVDISTQLPNNDMSGDIQAVIFSSLESINFIVIILSFLFYFIGGYLLYASLFAAVGSAVDSETDTQQFMMPITVPLILGLVVMINAIQNPDGALAFWFSIIPFTSPIVMMARIPFGVPYLELLLSMALLVLTFFGTTWLAAKIYRTGILMYGKKVSYGEIWKWIRFKN